MKFSNKLIIFIEKLKRLTKLKQNKLSETQSSRVFCKTSLRFYYEDFVSLDLWVSGAHWSSWGYWGNFLLLVFLSQVFSLLRLLNDRSTLFEQVSWILVALHLAKIFVSLGRGSCLHLRPLTMPLHELTIKKAHILSLNLFYKTSPVIAGVMASLLTMNLIILFDLLQFF